MPNRGSAGASLSRSSNTVFSVQPLFFSQARFGRRYVTIFTVCDCSNLNSRLRGNDGLQFTIRNHRELLLFSCARTSVQQFES